MHSHELSSDDRQFRTEFEACRFAPENFTHRAHVRLAYTYLAENDTVTAAALMQTALKADVLFSDEARARFVEPNLDTIPRHEP